MAERRFPLPDLGEGLEEGEIVAWLVAEGDEVELNQPLVEIETAKATVEIPSPFAGRIATLHVSVGASVPVGTPLVTFDVEAGPGDPGPAEIAEDPGSRAAATPAVRRLARDLGVDLGSVAPTGPGGRATAGDVRRAAGQGQPAAAALPTQPAPEDDVDRIALTPTRRAIAANLERQASIPQVTTFRTIDASAIGSVRSEIGTSPLPILIAAIARIAADHPLINSSWAGDAIAVHRSVHAGIATDTDRGLVVPVVRDVAGRGISDLASEIRRLAADAREGTLTPEDASGATIAVSNTGSYGSESGTPILSPGTAVTIAMGRIAPRAIVVGDEVVPRPACTLSITFDHRVLDGAAVGRAANQLVALLQDPDALRDLPR